MSFTAEQKDGALNITFAGRMDTTECMFVEGDFKKTVDAHSGGIVFNMADVDYISSSFLRLCTYAAKKAGEGNFRITNVDPVIKKVFKISGMDTLFKVE
jgi:anti-anti-sigma factor